MEQKKDKQNKNEQKNEQKNEPKDEQKDEQKQRNLILRFYTSDPYFKTFFQYDKMKKLAMTFIEDFYDKKNEVSNEEKNKFINHFENEMNMFFDFNTKEYIFNVTQIKSKMNDLFLEFFNRFMYYYKSNRIHSLIVQIESITKPKPMSQLNFENYKKYISEIEPSKLFLDNKIILKGRQWTVTKIPINILFETPIDDSDYINEVYNKLVTFLPDIETVKSNLDKIKSKNTEVNKKISTINENEKGYLSQQIDSFFKSVIPIHVENGNIYDEIIATLNGIGQTGEFNVIIKTIVNKTKSVITIYDNISKLFDINRIGNDILIKLEYIQPHLTSIEPNNQFLIDYLQHLKTECLAMFLSNNYNNNFQLLVKTNDYLNNVYKFVLFFEYKTKGYLEAIKMNKMSTILDSIKEITIKVDKNIDVLNCSETDESKRIALLNDHIKIIERLFKNNGGFDKLINELKSLYDENGISVLEISDKRELIDEVFDDKSVPYPWRMVGEPEWWDIDVDELKKIIEDSQKPPSGKFSEDYDDSKPQKENIIRIFGKEIEKVLKNMYNIKENIFDISKDTLFKRIKEVGFERGFTNNYKFQIFYNQKKNNWLSFLSWYFSDYHKEQSDLRKKKEEVPLPVLVPVPTDDALNKCRENVKKLEEELKKRMEELRQKQTDETELKTRLNVLNDQIRELQLQKQNCDENLQKIINKSQTSLKKSSKSKSSKSSKSSSLKSKKYKKQIEELKQEKEALIQKIQEYIQEKDNISVKLKDDDIKKMEVQTELLHKLLKKEREKVEKQDLEYKKEKEAQKVIEQNEKEILFQKIAKYKKEKEAQKVIEQNEKEILFQKIAKCKKEKEVQKIEYQNEKERLFQKISESNREKSKLQTKLQETLQEKRNGENELNRCIENVKVLETELQENLNGEYALNQCRENVKILEEKLEQKINDENELKAKLNILHTQISDLRYQREKCNKDFDNKEKELDALQKKCKFDEEKYKLLISKLENEKNKLEEQNAKLEEEINNMLQMINADAVQNNYGVDAVPYDEYVDADNIQYANAINGNYDVNLQRKLNNLNNNNQTNQTNQTNPTNPNNQTNPNNPNNPNNQTNPTNPNNPNNNPTNQNNNPNNQILNNIRIKSQNQSQNQRQNQSQSQRQNQFQGQVQNHFLKIQECEESKRQIIKKIQELNLKIENMTKIHNDNMKIKQAEIDKLKSQLEAANIKNSKTKESIQKKQKEINDLKTSLKQKSIDNSQLKKKIQSQSNILNRSSSTTTTSKHSKIPTTLRNPRDVATIVTILKKYIIDSRNPQKQIEPSDKKYINHIIQHSTPKQLIELLNDNYYGLQLNELLYTAINIRIKKNKYKYVKLISSQSNIIPWVQYEYGHTVLDILSRHVENEYNLKCVQVLIQNPLFDINSQYEGHRHVTTPLIQTIIHNRNENTKLLLNHMRCNINLCDYTGKTAMDYVLSIKNTKQKYRLFEMFLKINQARRKSERFFFSDYRNIENLSQELKGVFYKTDKVFFSDLYQTYYKDNPAKLETFERYKQTMRGGGGGGGGGGKSARVKQSYFKKSGLKLRHRQNTKKYRYKI
jgi:hypothetical protein